MLGWLSEKGKLLFLAKTLRVFGFGFLSIILPLYMLRLGYSALIIGIVISMAVFGSVVFNTLISKFSDSFGRRKSLIILSIMMAISTILMIFNINAMLFVIAAFIGSVSVTGTETGPFLSIEQSAISSQMNESNRTKAYSVYNFLGYGAAAFGALFSGVPSLFNNSLSWYQILLYVYLAIAIALIFIYVSLGESIELPQKESRLKITKRTKKIIIKLSVLFSIDAFGGGFILQSLLTLWFNSRYGVGVGDLSILFLITNIITAMSILAAPFVAKKIGLLNTMVIPHILSNISLIAIPFASSLFYAVTLLFVRQSLSQMDVPSRQSYLMAIVKPNERTAAAGITNIPRSIAQGVSPTISSYLIGTFQYSLPFILSGSLKILYDILLFFSFRKTKPPEERK
ncbi:MFS transporter [Candidatus Parvarchaeota archaeon]|nr:MFS transporter [Candidatus Parvarchaeota archaeon]